jgi:hypothetical protein
MVLHLCAVSVPRTAVRWAALLLLTLAPGRCHAAEADERQSNASTELPTKRAATVDVGGLIGDPGEVEIPKEGLTLRQALSKAGGPRKERVRKGQGPLMVCLERVGSDRTEQSFFPLDFVSKDVAGSVPLRGNDKIKVTPFEQTRIGMRDAKPSKIAIAVEGIVERPGKYELKPGLDAVVNVLTSEYCGALQAKDNERVVLVLSRTVPPTRVQRYYLPLFTPYLTRHVLLASLGSNDHLLYVRLGDLNLFESRPVAARSPPRRCACP